MKRSLKKGLAAMTAVFSLAAAAGAYAYYSDIAAVTNHITLGDVNIVLREYTIRNGKETAYENPVQILPGDSVSKIPKITNYGEPCWIRARITYENNRGDLEGFSDGNISGISSDWVKRGEYYYYTRILGRMETVTLFSGVTVPWQWTESHSEQELAVGIRTDAIQSSHFSPDFHAMSPWGDQEIELCVHEVNGVETERKKDVLLSVEFEGSSHKLVAVPDDFFRNFQSAMPGDTLKDYAEIFNTTSKSAELFFHTGLVCQREDRMNLLKKLGLTIDMDGKKIYSGNLMALELADEVSLGVFSPGKRGILNFTVTVPPDLGNDYALRDTMVKWFFTVYEKEPEGASPLAKSPTVTEPPEIRSPERTTSPKTGDEAPVLEYALLLGTSLAGGMAALALRKGGKKT